MGSLNANNYSLRMNRTANLPSGDFTFIFWGRRATAGDGSPHAFATLTSSNNAWELYAFEGDMRMWVDASSADNTVKSAETGWHFFALVRSGSTVTLYHRADADASLSSMSAGTSTGAIASHYWFSWNDGATDAATQEQVRCGRLWNVALTSTQILAESRKSTPVVTSGIVASYAHDSHLTAGVDSSGNGYNLTTSGTGATSSDQPTFPDDSSSISGSGAATAPNPTGAGAGTQANNATGAGTVPAPTGSGSGTVGSSAISGSGGANVPAPSGAGAGTQTASGAGAAGVPAPTGAATGTESISGSGAAGVPAPIATGSSSNSIGGAGAANVPTPSGSGAGSQSLSAAGAGGVPAPTVSGSGSLKVNGAGTAGLSGPTGSGQGSLIVPGAGAAIIAPPVGAGSQLSIQRTSVNANGKSSTSGYRLKRGNPSNTSSFFSGASTIIVRAKIADWSSGADIPDFQNIIDANYDGGGGDSHYAQFYNEISSGKIRLYKGEGVAPFPVDPTLRSGSYSGWFLVGFRCLGSLTDPLEAFFISDDEASGAFQSITMNAAGGLRQLYIFGQQLLPTIDEQCNQLYACTAIVSKRYWSNAEILAQRFVDYPTLTGSHIFSFLPMRNVATAHVDESNLYGGTGGNDFEFGMLALGLTANDSPYNGAISGSGAASATAPNAAATGTLANQATGAGGVPAPTVVAGGTQAVGGAGVANSPAPSVATVGTLSNSGSGAGGVPAPTGGGSGSLALGGSGNGNVPAPNAASSGATTNSGAGSASITGPNGSGSGSLSIVGSGGANVPAPIGTATQSPYIGGNGAAALTAPSVAGAGIVSNPGAGSATAPTPTGSGSGSQALSGGGSGALAPPVASGSGTLIDTSISGTGAGRVPAPSGLGSGSLRNDGTGAATLPPVAASSQPEVLPVADVAFSLAFVQRIPVRLVTMNKKLAEVTAGDHVTFDYGTLTPGEGESLDGAEITLVAFIGDPAGNDYRVEKNESNGVTLVDLENGSKLVSVTFVPTDWTEAPDREFHLFLALKVVLANGKRTVVARKNYLSVQRRLVA